jgi:hypothetical protein
MQKNITLEDVLVTLVGIATSLGKETKNLTLKDCSDNGLSERQIRKFGGLSKIKAAHFPETGKSLGEIKSLTDQAAYIRKLETQLAKKQLTEKLVEDTLNKITTPLNIPKANISTKKSGLHREVVVSLNDTHFGLIVDPKEVGGTNKFGWQEASRRTAMLAQQVADYKIEKRGEVKKLHVVLNGDIVQGKIHDMTALTSDLMVMQQNGAIHILTHFIGYVSQFYPEVVVHGISGNHDDSLHRREGGRVTSHKYDSVINPVYYALSAAFRNESKISFNFPKGLHIDLNLPGGRAVFTHGDTLFSKQMGNPGTNVNVKGLSDVINRWNQAEIAKGNKPANLFVFGHTHFYCNFRTFDGVQVLILPCLSGIDSYAHSLALNHNNADQGIFESTPGYNLGDLRVVDLLKADSNSELDKIIPVYDRGLQWRK